MSQNSAGSVLCIKKLHKRLSHSKAWALFKLSNSHSSNYSNVQVLQFAVE